MATMPTTPTLPGEDDLRVSLSALMEVESETVMPLMSRVFEFTNDEAASEVTFEQIGRLAAWADYVERLATYIAERAANMKEVAIRELPSIALEGQQVAGSNFNRFGSRSA